MSKTVLICDDAMFMRSILKDILSKADFEVVGEASSGDEAVAKYKELNPDLVTMDIVMPGKNGIETVKEIISQDADARILMCSAVGQQALVRQALESGARDFVIKPFDQTRVMEAVDRVLG